MALRARPSAESRRGCVNIVGLPVCLDSTLTAADSAYVVILLGQVIPFMTQVLGAPVGLDTLTVMQHHGGNNYFWYIQNAIDMLPRYETAGVDDDHDGLIDEDPQDGRDNDADGHIDEDARTSRSWDNTFIHELAHAFQTSVLGWYPDWLDEGMAEATTYFVSEAATSAVGNRNFRYHPNGAQMANFDLLDQAGGQFWGGGTAPINIPEVHHAYWQASCTVLLPVLAEIGAGHTSPHPLARLTEELRSEIDAPHYPRMYEAIDRAWSTPVDGIMPPSRWLRSRAFANPFLRYGRILKIVPDFDWTGGFNAKTIETMYWERSEQDGTDVLYAQPAALSVVDVKGNRIALAGWAVPPLSPGAYLVEGHLANGSEVLNAQTWIYIGSNAGVVLDTGLGTVVMFVGRDGRPVDMPDASVTGRVIERVPGGMRVESESVFSPGDAFTFSNDGQVIGTVTRAGNLPRVVPIFVDDPCPAGALSWKPYHPVAGEPLTLLLRAAESALTSGDAPQLARIYKEVPFWQLDQPYVETAVSETAVRGIFSAQFSVPPDWNSFTPQFLGAVSQHGQDMYCPWDPECLVIRVSPARDIEAVHVTRIGDSLAFQLNGDANPDSLTLFYGEAPDQPWIASGASPLPDPSQPFSWLIALDPEAHASRLLRVTYSAGEGVRDLFQASIGSLQSRPGVRSLPAFPNPTSDEIRWAVESDAIIAVDFEVFDIQGRRVHGPERVSLAPGRREFRWNGMTNQNTFAPSGVFLLSLTGPHVKVREKAVLVCNRVRR